MHVRAIEYTVLTLLYKRVVLDIGEINVRCVQTQCSVVEATHGIEETSRRWWCYSADG